MRIKAQRTPRRQSFDAGERRSSAGNVVKTEIVIQALQVRSFLNPRQFQQRLRLRGKCKTLSLSMEIERLDTETIARAEDRLFASVHESEGKHAVQSRERDIALADEQLQQHLGIGVIGDKSCALPLQLVAQRRGIEYLAVINENVSAVGARHRLMPTAPVYYRQASHADAQIFLAKHAPFIGTAMPQRLIDSFDECWLLAADNSDYPAHLDLHTVADHAVTAFMHFILRYSGLLEPAANFPQGCRNVIFRRERIKGVHDRPRHQLLFSQLPALKIVPARNHRA